MNFLLDVHIPASIGILLERKGHEVVRADKLFPPGTTDDKLAEHAKITGSIIVSCDLGFTNSIRFPPEEYPGFIVIRSRIQSLRLIIKLFEAFLEVSDVSTCVNRITIVEPFRVRQFPSKYKS